MTTRFRRTFRVDKYSAPYYYCVPGTKVQRLVSMIRYSYVYKEIGWPRARWIPEPYYCCMVLGLCWRPLSALTCLPWTYHQSSDEHNNEKKMKMMSAQLKQQWKERVKGITIFTVSQPLCVGKQGASDAASKVEQYAVDVLAICPVRMIRIQVLCISYHGTCIHEFIDSSALCTVFSFTHVRKYTS